jgi:hypothetical protein
VVLPRGGQPARCHSAERKSLERMFTIRHAVAHPGLRRASNRPRKRSPMFCVQNRVQLAPRVPHIALLCPLQLTDSPFAEGLTPASQGGISGATRDPLRLAMAMVIPSPATGISCKVKRPASRAGQSNELLGHNPMVEMECASMQGICESSCRSRPTLTAYLRGHPAKRQVLPTASC